MNNSFESSKMGELEQYLEQVKQKYLDAFKESFSDLIKQISGARLVEQFSNEIYSNNIVSRSLIDNVLTTTGVSEYKRASDLMRGIDSDLQGTADYGRVQSIVLKICKILLTLDDPVMSETAKKIMQKLNEVPEIIATSLCKSNFETMVESIPVPFELFYAEGIIQKDATISTVAELRHIATTNGISSVSLLHSLIVKAISVRTSKFMQLTASLRTQRLAGLCFAKQLEKELSECRKLFPVPAITDEGLVFSDAHHKGEVSMSTQRVRIPSDVEKKIDDMFLKYDDLIYDIKSLFIKANEQDPQDKIHSLQNVKNRLKASRYYHSSSDEIESFSSVGEVIEFAAKRNTCLLNVQHLQWLVERFDIPNGKEKIDDYQSDLKRFMKDTKLDLINNKRISKAILSKAETIEFTIAKDLEEVLMRDIKEIICQIFEEELCLDVIVEVVSRTKSITFICHAPESIIQLLIMKAQDNLQTLIQDIGLMSLKIGYCTLLDFKPIVAPLSVHAKTVETQKGKPDDYLETIEKLKKENEDLRMEVKRHEDLTAIIQQRKKENEILQKSLEEFKKDKDDLNAELKKAIAEKDEFAAECETVKQKMELMVQNQLQLKEDNDELNSKCQVLEKKSKVQINELEKEIGKNKTLQFDLTTTKEDKEQFEKLKEDKDKEVEKLNVTNDELRKECLELQKSSMDQKGNLDSLNDQLDTLKGEFNKRVPLLSFYHQHERDAANYPPITMVMTNFYDHKHKSIGWFSPGFYSHKEGYKLCVKIEANGKKSGHGTHVSALVHVMKGEYDDSLSWPLTAEVELELLNRYADNNHRTVTLRFDESSVRESRERVYSGIITDSGTCAGSGVCEDQLIKHGDLNDQYLKDDSIFIRIKSITIRPMQPSLSVPKTPIHTSTTVHEFTLSNFSKLKLKNERWKSEPFYSHENGYRLVMTVQPNGEHTYKGRYVALFLHMARGDHDDQLVFPFRGTIYVQLLNRLEDRNHAEFAVKFDEESDPKGRRGARFTRLSIDYLVDRHSSDGWGTACLIRHDLLPRNEYRNTEYLRDDELKIRINKIEIYSG